MTKYGFCTGGCVVPGKGLRAAIGRRYLELKRVKVRCLSYEHYI